MRIASRVVGVVLVLTGLGFVALPGYVFAIGQWSSGAAIWILCAILVGVGIGCLLAGKYFLRLDFNEPEDTQVQPSSRFAPYFLVQRRELPDSLCGGWFRTRLAGTMGGMGSRLSVDLPTRYWEADCKAFDDGFELAIRSRAGATGSEDHGERG